MSRTVRAFVARDRDTPPGIEEITLPETGPHQVRVRILAAGVCHTDLSMVNGTLSPQFPLVLGHEAAGVVVETGSAVRSVHIGDHVILNWSPACRECWFCDNGEPWICETSGTPSYPGGSTRDGVPVNVTLGLGSLAEEVVVGESAVVPFPAEVPAEQAALLGCAVLTGVGAVRNTAGVAEGDTVAVIGLGGVGLSVVIAARAAGAAQVIAVDVTEAKRDLALAAGATDFLLAGDTLVKAIRTATGGRGVDHAFECVGRSASITAAWKGTRRGGSVTVLGIGKRDDLVTLGALDIFHSARTLRSSVYGSSDPDRDLPVLAQSVLDGDLDLRPLISHRITLDEAPEAFARLSRGEGARSVVVF
ncbi:S-(hydroxymethyl)glutathione dehydrogenase/alcohol dehydrogenase [Allocatelliglobosispora scoriae]|uniref:S-(Hydroxymethyl)glutathione dehydrogenase/alcohol dehydrogenase n=1 Tax=Allocatelliglobosispora scoriae TaxID=643052 RepID=A0A841C0G6_9ACTN|nr:alcohol dehydrogenase catalytic domain-containing protein [Allocatelliglobosispora scoriae]MBB5872643.1 S-(hydroxymethyl)glutathione dehydrogenase/alcohol dehydrogenase [Allocatelliglobosispora scoriae]